MQTIFLCFKKDFFMDEAEVIAKKDFSKSPLNKNKTRKEFKVKCLGWCDKEFMSESKFIRFCERCKAKKTKISEDNCRLDIKSTPSGMFVEKESFNF